MSPPPQPPAAAEDQDETARHRTILHDLLDRAAALARLVHEDALQATAEDRRKLDPTIAFDRIARVIRRTIALARKLAQDPAPPATPRQARPHRDPTPPSDAESCKPDRPERPEDPDREFDLESRPVPELIAEIARDLDEAESRQAATRAPPAAQKPAPTPERQTLPPEAGKHPPPRPNPPSVIPLHPSSPGSTHPSSTGLTRGPHPHRRTIPAPDTHPPPRAGPPPPL